jgi:hypothetical protein
MLDTCADGNSYELRFELTDASSPPGPAPFITTTLPTTTTTTTVTPSEAGTAAIASCRKRDETVTIANAGTSVLSLSGWVLHDEGRKHSYTFGSITLEPAATVIVMTGPDNVADDPNEILWKSQHVWNNDGDTAFLLDPSGAQVDSRGC